MEEASLLVKIIELLGVHAAAPLLALLAAGVLYKRNLELQRKLFKLAHAQILALAKMESTLETTIEALKAANRDRERLRCERERTDRDRDRDLDSH